MKICLVFLVFLVLATARHLSHGWGACDPRWDVVLSCPGSYLPICGRFPDGAAQMYRNDCAACTARKTIDGKYVKVSEIQAFKC